MDKNQLRYLIYQKDKEFERNKGRRQLLAVLYHASVLFFLFLAFFAIAVGFDGWSFGTVAVIILICLLCGFIAFWINMSIYGNIFIKGKEENEILVGMKKRLEEEIKSEE